jgi:hypothetical protein
MKACTSRSPPCTCCVPRASTYHADYVCGQQWYIARRFAGRIMSPDLRRALAAGAIGRAVEPCGAVAAGRARKSGETGRMGTANSTRRQIPSRDMQRHAATCARTAPASDAMEPLRRRSLVWLSWLGKPGPARLRTLQHACRSMHHMHPVRSQPRRLQGGMAWLQGWPSLGSRSLYARLRLPQLSSVESGFFLSPHCFLFPCFLFLVSVGSGFLCSAGRLKRDVPASCLSFSRLPYVVGFLLHGPWLAEWRIRGRPFSANLHDISARYFGFRLIARSVYTVLYRSVCGQ